VVPWTCAALAACFVADEPVDQDAVRVGALLPYTGDVAATGANIERAILGVVRQVNEAGGIAGRPVRLLARDTHSNTRRGYEQALDLLENDVVAILGPQDEELASQMGARSASQKVVVVSGGLTSPFFTTLPDNGFWFRTCPTARELAPALVQRMALDGVRKAAVVYVGDVYGSGMAAILTNALVSAGIQAPRPVSFQSTDRGFTHLLRPLLAESPEAIILVAHAKSGAQIVQEWEVLGGRTRWYLAPTLKADVFVTSAPPGALDGAVGISASLGTNVAGYAERFAEDWGGEQPLDAAYFYHDATAITLLAIARATKLSGGKPSGAEIRDQVTVVAGPPGDAVGWDDLPRALRLVEEGRDIDYQGVTGTVDLDVNGDLVDARVSLWSIRNQRIENL
jgi:ABC-type branched-subunit amino acid transport system substrate-binding protein